MGVSTLQQAACLELSGKGVTQGNPSWKVRSRHLILAALYMPWVVCWGAVAC